MFHRGRVIRPLLNSLYMKFSDRNDWTIRLTDTSYFEQDKMLFYNLLPNSKLRGQIEKANDFTKRRLSGKMIFELLSVVGPERIIENRLMTKGPHTPVLNSGSDEEKGPNPSDKGSESGEESSLVLNSGSDEEKGPDLSDKGSESKEESSLVLSSGSDEEKDPDPSDKGSESKEESSPVLNSDSDDRKSTDTEKDDTPEIFNDPKDPKKKEENSNSQE